MARKKVEEFRPRGIEGWLDGRRHFNSEEMRAVLLAADPSLLYEAEKVGPTITGKYAQIYLRLKDTLDHSALTYELRRTNQERPTASAMGKELRKVEAAAFRLLEALYVTSGSAELPHGLEGDLYDEAKRQIDARDSEDIHAWARGERSKGRKRWGSPPSYVEAKEVVRGAVLGIRNLAELAGRAAKKREAVAATAPEPRRDKDDAEDSFVGQLMHAWKAYFNRTDVTTQDFRRFAYAAMRVVHPDLKPHAIRGRVNRLLKTEDFEDFYTSRTIWLGNRSDL